jgi:hypothetical protein
MAMLSFGGIDVSKDRLDGEQIDPGKIAAWSGEATDETQSGGVFSNEKDDGDRRGGRLGRHRRSSARPIIFTSLNYSLIRILIPRQPGLPTGPESRTARQAMVL